uniref:Copper transport protein n=1 Tax=Albugo laibachii Nc14 TaxID=890382 RepID=F0WA45_9STRA|nr:conserved hypothetical protein [Albugo laibachii Nc14]|eukprot:CCA18015.1 conserved hypothetical protein [Albugo laibachii Nc14]
MRHLRIAYSSLLVCNGYFQSLMACGPHRSPVYEPRSLLTTFNASEHKCPACGMSTIEFGYDNQNYVVFNNGQRVYTCGMDPRSFSGYSFDVSDTSYIAANMAEFIQSPDDPQCAKGCPECITENINDPIDNTKVTPINVQSICIKNGQKIYFSSAERRQKYLGQVNKEPRHLVQKAVCKNAPCADLDKIQDLSKASKDFVSKYDAVALAGTRPEPQGFCTGKGSVMLNGFQSSVHGSCIRLFFFPWVLNSQVKYAFGFIGIFLIAVGNEYLAKCREQLRRHVMMSGKSSSHRRKWTLVLATLYMIQMVVAYFAMLVVMTYETGLFIALILGFGAGFLFFKKLEFDDGKKNEGWRHTDASTVCVAVDGMTCATNCGKTVENALRGVDGVDRVYVDFDQGKAYVSGTANVDVLTDAIQSVGFGARIQDPRANLHDQ